MQSTIETAKNILGEAPEDITARVPTTTFNSCSTEFEQNIKAGIVPTPKDEQEEAALLFINLVGNNKLFYAPTYASDMYEEVFDMRLCNISDKNGLNKYKTVVSFVKFISRISNGVVYTSSKGMPLVYTNFRYREFKNENGEKIENFNKFPKKSFKAQPILLHDLFAMFKGYEPGTYYVDNRLEILESSLRLKEPTKPLEFEVISE